MKFTRTRIAVLILFAAAIGMRREACAQASVSGVEVGIRVVFTDPGYEGLELEVKNHGDKPVYVVTAPKRSNGDMQPSLEADPDDPSTVLLEYRFWAAGKYPISGNQASAAIALVKPGEGITTAPVFKIPLERTEPPYGAAPLTPGTFPNHFRKMKAVVGVLPQLPSLDKMSEVNRGFNWYSGSETVDLGNGKTKTLLELQQLITSQIELFSVE